MELYNLETDLGEKNDLSESKPEKKKLRKKLNQWRKNVGAQPPNKNSEHE